MHDSASILPEFSGTVRLFPLPNLVFFPSVMQGLHVFEPRYRQLVADCLAGDRLMTLVLLKPDWEAQYDQNPPIESVACVGRIGPYEALPDGRFNLTLRGLSRVKLIAEVPTDRMYRVAQAELITDVTPDELATLISLRSELKTAVLSRFTEGSSSHTQLEELLSGEMPLGAVCDMLGYALPLPLQLKQELLTEPRVVERASRLTNALALPVRPSGRKFPPEFSPD